jgi:hypothetical protein
MSSAEWKGCDCPQAVCWFWCLDVFGERYSDLQCKCNPSPLSSPLHDWERKHPAADKRVALLPTGNVKEPRIRPINPDCMRETDILVITLYVPDATARLLGGGKWFQEIILTGSPLVDFVLPGWWEGCHTARLGPLSHTGVGADEEESEPGAQPCGG